MSATLTPREERKPIWQSQGHAFARGSTPTSVKEALKAGGLDWTVEKVPVFVKGSERGYAKVPGRFAIQRSTDAAVLGVVGGPYVPFQNEDALGFITSLVDSGEVEWDTVGALRNGRWIWAALKLPGDIVVKGRKGITDEIRRNLVISSSHDGSRSIQAFTSHVCIVCENTLAMAIRTAQTRWAVRHTDTLEGRIAEAKSSLELVHQHDADFEKLMNSLAYQKFDEAGFSNLVDLLTPQPNVRERVKELYATTPNVTDGFKNTKYGALQVVGEAFDWLSVHDERDPAAALESTWAGKAYKMRTKALTLLTDQSGVLETV